MIPILNGKGIMSQAKWYVVKLLVHGDITFFFFFEIDYCAPWGGDITLLMGRCAGYHGDPSKHPNTSSSSSSSSIQLS